MKLERLASLAEEYYDEFVKAKRDWEEGRERIYAVERLAQLLAQTVLDFAAVLASRMEGRKPESYKELAEFLASKIGYKDFLIGLAGFRNVLVHMYVDIDEGLEREAFNEIEKRMRGVINKLKEIGKGDPCLRDVKEKVRGIAKRWNLRYVAVIGSVARDGCGNDVDLVVKFGRRVKLLDVGRLLAELEDSLRTKVDLIVLDFKVDPIMAKTIVDEAKLIYGNEEEFEEDLLKLYKFFLDESHLALRGHLTNP